MLGGKWWSSEENRIRKRLGYDESSERERSEQVLGWPIGPGNGSVWVLRLANEDARPKDFGKLMLCTSMDERCNVLKEWGAEFYEDARQVEEFKDLF